MARKYVAACKACLKREGRYALKATACLSCEKGRRPDCHWCGKPVRKTRRCVRGTAPA